MTDVVGLVLCGGAGRRMGGADKGLIQVDGLSNAERAVRLLNPLCGRCFVSANRNLEFYASIEGVEVISDLRSDYQGPLAGLEALAPILLEVKSDARLILLPCDLPKLSHEVPKRLLAELGQREDMDIIYASTPHGGHYLCAALRISVLAKVSQRLDGSDYSVRGWYASCKSASLSFGTEFSEGFLNLNRVDDLDRQDQIIGNKV
ncbi:molybdenum cofactor guanylyltransferase [Congregibacter brevis]|uniref:Molybdenum cofactor guanylyltransferase n=1 Tax=Congregibacter brevis TaxID=3081201 RepID=A0ABZ0IBK4_9GAMM|nr:molybdenum cofactor guanylyltransferase [Congregibacter sp. IMCC45268]